MLQGEGMLLTPRGLLQLLAFLGQLVQTGTLWRQGPGSGLQAGNAIRGNGSDRGPQEPSGMTLSSAFPLFKVGDLFCSLGFAIRGQRPNASPSRESADDNVGCLQRRGGEGTACSPTVVLRLRSCGFCLCWHRAWLWEVSIRGTAGEPLHSNTLLSRETLLSL